MMVIHLFYVMFKVEASKRWDFCFNHHHQNSSLQKKDTTWSFSQPRGEQFYEYRLQMWNRPHGMRRACKGSIPMVGWPISRLSQPFLRSWNQLQKKVVSEFQTCFFMFILGEFPNFTSSGWVFHQLKIHHTMWHLFPTRWCHAHPTWTYWALLFLGNLLLKRYLAARSQVVRSTFPRKTHGRQCPWKKRKKQWLGSMHI